MIRMRLFSNDRETFEVVDSDDRTLIVVHSLWEAVHFAGVVLGLRRVFKQQDEALEDTGLGEAMGQDKPVVLKYGLLKVRIS